MTLGFETSIFLVWVLLLLPALGVHSYYHVKQGKPLAPKLRRFLATIWVEVLLLALALAAAPPALLLFPKVLPDALTWLYAALLLAVLLVGVARGLKRMPAEERQKARLFLPETPEEFLVWTVISLLAGVCEEVAYRGVLYRLLLDAFGSMALAILVATLAFALAHAAHGGRATLRVAALGCLFHAIVLLTGTLYVAMTVHAVYDFVVGFLLMKSFRAEVQVAPTTA